MCVFLMLYGFWGVFILHIAIWNKGLSQRNHQVQCLRDYSSNLQHRYLPIGAGLSLPIQSQMTSRVKYGYYVSVMKVKDP